MLLLFGIILFLIILWLLLRYSAQSYKNNSVEGFRGFKPIIDPEPIELFKKISEKEQWWNETHAKQLYSYYNYVPMSIKD